jgi:hypothetical protein
MVAIKTPKQTKTSSVGLTCTSPCQKLNAYPPTPRSDKTGNKKKQPKTTKKGPEPNATNTKQPPIAVMGTARAHRCRKIYLQ